MLIASFVQVFERANNVPLDAIHMAEGDGGNAVLSPERVGNSAGNP
ncbi:hypothetical protein [Roseococcus pinisoli]|uniref:Uncharacterized protein n=1 Tax=Roseococcus pinisoli TaxID=2835040 RepID=A0ABS5QDK9_9PROT|nr:hypothetical protein [Roseococcus pinisoli]MBS7811040.1 hypothetical protein [Roseococcus pinisoli]